METRGVLVLCVACLGVFTCARGDKKDIYAKVVDLVAPGEEYLTEDALLSLFERLENRVQCSGVSCGKCLSVDHLSQLLSNYSSSQGLQMEDFFTVAPGFCLFLSAPLETCRAIQDSRWGVQTEHFIEMIYGHNHEHNSTTDHPPHGDITENQGLEKMFNEMEKYYQPDTHEPCLTMKDILEESSHQHGDHTHTELDAVMGNVLYHALRGDCMKAHHLPEQQYFLDYIFSHYSSDSLTLHESLGSSRCWLLQACFSAGDLLRIHQLNSSSLSRDQFTQISPALIQQILSGGCSEISPAPVSPDTLSTAERYGYATLANLIICLMAMFGIVVLLFSACTQVFEFCIQFCISLAVGSLTGDALLHLLPAFLGLHVHEDGHDHDHAEENLDYVYKLLVLIAGIYFFYLMEGIFSIMTRREHHHNHDEVSLSCETASITLRTVWQSARRSPSHGGDFAILLHCGLSVKLALLLNVASSLTSFIGLYIALSVSTETVAKEWISAVTAGLFLYVGLADMLPSLVHVDSKRPWLIFLLQNLGLLSGWGILLLLSLYEDQIGL
uniref:Zinc transporter ZIP4 n=1 Tax=Cyprinus carpio TaxID=7962 RepID=A0A089ZWW2_CYPCA|nr:solute carrier family 39 member 4-1 [Cyprinus carpio]